MLFRTFLNGVFSDENAPELRSCFWPLLLGVTRQTLRRDVLEECYDKQQKAATLHDLRTPTRQYGRSPIRQYRRGLLGMHRRYRGGNGMRRVARLRTPRIRGRTSAWLDRSVQAMTRTLDYDCFGSKAAASVRSFLTSAKR